MRIATWNINGLRARLDYLKLWLEARQPDLVGIQELKLVDEHFPAGEFEALGYRSAAFGQKSWNGVAILSRQPLEEVERGLGGQEELGARVLSARSGGLRFTTVYVPNGKSVEHDDFPRKLAWLDALAAHWKSARRADEPAVLCGDLNLCPTGLDSWNEQGFRGRIFHTDDERQRFRALLEAGLLDLFREQHPETRAYSWWDYRGGAFHKKQGLRIDLVLGTPPVRARLRAAGIDRDWRKKQQGLTPSDHAPVWVDLAD